MGRSPTYTSDPWQGTYSEIIDVRSEAEFAEDCIPGAINLPVLNNKERVKVGTIYKQVSPFEARKFGAAIVSKNISAHLESHFTGKDKGYSPLVYCWRGGQRSNSLALVLAQIGWQVTVLKGGYKTYRAYVREQLANLPGHTYKVLCGLTGTGKTHLLRRLAQQGVQVLDLEGLANHRGSLLGQEWEQGVEAQPSQKRFESLLLQELQKFDPSRTVWVESESNKIGEVYLPPALWEKMKQAIAIEVQLPQAARVEFLLQEYPHLVEYPDLLKQKLESLKSRHGGQKIRHWFSLIDADKWQLLVADLLTSHYDPAYRRSMSNTYTRVAEQIQIPDLSNTSVETAVNQLSSI